jgi:hypothetical protein
MTYTTQAYRFHVFQIIFQAFDLANASLQKVNQVSVLVGQVLMHAKN